jgi:hypothetical protein
MKACVPRWRFFGGSDLKDDPSARGRSEPQFSRECSAAYPRIFAVDHLLIYVMRLYV